MHVLFCGQVISKVGSIVMVVCILIIMILQVAITELSAVKVAKASLKGPFENNWGTNVGEIRIAKWQNTTEIEVSIVGFKNA